MTQTRFRATGGADTEQRGPGSRCRPSSPGQRRPGPRAQRGRIRTLDGVGGSAAQASGGERLEARPSSHCSPSALRSMPEARRPAQAGDPPSAAGAKARRARFIWSMGHVPQRLRPMPGPHTSPSRHTARRARQLLHGHLHGWVEGWPLRLSSETKESARCPCRVGEGSPEVPWSLCAKASKGQPGPMPSARDPLHKLTVSRLFRNELV